MCLCYVGPSMKGTLISSKKMQEKTLWHFQPESKSGESIMNNGILTIKDLPKSMRVVDLGDLSGGWNPTFMRSLFWKQGKPRTHGPWLTPDTFQRWEEMLNELSSKLGPPPYHISHALIITHISIDLNWTSRFHSTLTKKKMRCCYFYVQWFCLHSNLLPLNSSLYQLLLPPLSPFSI